MSKLKPVMVREMAVKRMNPFIFIGEMRGLKQGIRKGRQVGARTLVLRLLRRRLGPLPDARRRAIENLSLRKVEALGEALLDFHSPEDVTLWLRKNSAPATTRKTAKAPQRSRRR